MKSKGLSFKSGLSLKRLILLSWIIPGIFVGAVSIGTFILVGWFDHKNTDARLIDELREKSRIVSRRLSAELLLGSKGAIGAVSQLLEKQLFIPNVSIESDAPCLNHPHIEPDFCVSTKGDTIRAFRRIPLVDAPLYAKLKIEHPSIAKSISLQLLLFSAFPVSLLLILGLFIQRLLLKRYLIQPIQSLIPITIEEKKPPGYWPQELQELSRHLTQSFKERDQVIFGQLASGVIHDMKTFLHSILTATGLVEELPSGSEKRSARLESLYKACSINIPKMSRIIDLTLDGKREIPLRSESKDIIQTIENSIRTNKTLAESKNVSVNFNQTIPVQILHDPIQLERVFTNLIKNGIEACNGNHNQSQQPKTVQISTHVEPNQQFSIIIEDSGEGILEGTTSIKALHSTKVHGAGLGLYVSKKIVEAHNGKIDISNSPTLHGARFTVTLPFSTKTTEAVQ